MEFRLRIAVDAHVVDRPEARRVERLPDAQPLEKRLRARRKRVDTGVEPRAGRKRASRLREQGHAHAGLRQRKRRSLADETATHDDGLKSLGSSTHATHYSRGGVNDAGPKRRRFPAQRYNRRLCDGGLGSGRSDGVVRHCIVEAGRDAQWPTAASRLARTDRIRPDGRRGPGPRRRNPRGLPPSYAPRPRRPHRYRHSGFEGFHEPQMWDRRLAQRGQVHPVQRVDQGRHRRRELSVLHDRAERGHRRSAGPAPRQARRDRQARAHRAGRGRVRRHRGSGRGRLEG